MALNLFQVLPDTFIQESLATRTIYENLEALYELNNEVRLSLLDLLRLRKLKLFNGIVYAFGLNTYGQLGTGNTDNVKIPTPIDFSTIIDRDGRIKRVIRISAGDNHSLFLCEDGSVYSCGQGEFNRLGTGNTDSVLIPTPIDITNIGSKKVIQISADGYHSLILCEDGTVYSFGRNENGQLGTGDTDNRAIPTPINTAIIGEKRVIQISAGSYHSLILCEDGTVYSFGFGEDGVLGTGDTDNRAIPTPINTSIIGEKRVIQVSAGHEHSLILCEDGTVYSFGDNFSNQLGNGTISFTDNVIIPTPINTSNIGEKRVIQVSAGGDYSLILCEDSTVYSFGSNSDGQLGTGTSDNTNHIAIPTLIDTSNIGSKRIIQVSAGVSHSLILCENGFVYAFGRNDYGQLGTGISDNTNNIVIPTEMNTLLMDGQEVIDISAGDLHSLILT